MLKLFFFFLCGLPILAIAQNILERGLQGGKILGLRRA